MAIKPLKIPIPVGGLKPPWASEAAANEAAVLHNFWVHNGRLKSMEGRKRLNAIPLDSTATTPIKNHFLYEKIVSGNTKVYYPIVRCNNRLWLGISRRATASQACTVSAITVDSTSGWPQSGWLLVNGSKLLEYTSITATTFVGTFTAGEVTTDDIVETYDFRPLLGSAYGASTEYMRDLLASGDTGWVCDDVWHVQYGNDLYVNITSDEAPAATYPTVRWDGNYYCTGFALCDGTTAVTGVGTEWSANVSPGDIIYFRDHTKDDGAQWQFGTGARVILEVRSNTSLTLSGNGYNTVNKGVACLGHINNFVDYIIVSTHRWGVHPAVTTPTVAAAAGGTLNGDFKYKWRYKCSKTGYTGNISPASATVSPSTQKVTISSAWSTAPMWMDHDKVEIYRAAVTGGTVGTYYHIATLTRSGATYVFPATYADEGNANGAELEANAEYHTRPGTENGCDGFRKNGALKMVNWNGRLVGMQSSNSRRIRWSTLASPEYWPLFLMNSDTYVSDGSGDVPTPDLGGTAEITSSYITNIVPEGPNYFSTGIIGGNLLIGCPDRCLRWHGYDWTDFRASEGPSEGMIAPAAISDGGRTWFVGSRGLVALPYGLNTVEPIYAKLWPDGMGSRLLKHPKSDMLERIRLAKWNGFIVMACSEEQQTRNQHLYLYHAASGSWVTGHYSDTPASDIQAWGLEDGDGDLTFADNNSPYLWSMFRLTGLGDNSDFGKYSYWTPNAETPAGVQCKYISAPLKVDDTLIEPLKVKVVVRKPLVSQQVTLSVYTDGNMTTADWSDSQVTGAADAGAYEEECLLFAPRSCSRVIQLGISGTFTVPLEIIEITVYPSLRGES